MTSYERLKELPESASVKEHLIAAKRNYGLARRLYQSVASINPVGMSALDALRELQAALPDGMRTIDDFEPPKNPNWSLKAGYAIFDQAIAAASGATP